MTDANCPAEGQQRRSAGTWVMIGFIFALAIGVPVGLYLLSGMSFGNGGGGTSSTASATGTRPSAVANAVTPPLPTIAANPANHRTMDLLVIDQVTKQPIVGMTVEVTAQDGFRGRTGADGHVRVPLPADDHPDGFNLRVRGKNYVPIRMLWTTNQPALDDGIFPASYTMQMEHGTKIGGKLVDDAGKPVAGATLRFRFTKHFANPHQMIAAIAGMNPPQPPVSDAQGNWSFSGAPANCEEIYIIVRDRRDPNSNQGPPEAFTPLSDLYGGTATITVHRNTAANDTGNRATTAAVVQGTVTDADTGKPIEGVKIAVGFTGSDEQHARWGLPVSERVGLQISPGGKFQFSNADTDQLVNFRGQPGHIVLKVEAKGYLPVLIPPVKPGEGNAAFDVKMKRGEDLIVRIVGADGKPVSGAKARLAIGGGDVLSIRDGVAETPGDNVEQKSGPDGQIDFPAQIGNFAVIAMADGGFAQANQDALAKSKTIALLPCGRLEGRTMVGTKPAAGINLLFRNEMTGPYGPDQPHVRLYATAKADENGEFTVEHLAPGYWYIYLQSPPNSSTPNESMIRAFDVAAGETVRLTLGGTGRPVVGSVNLPADLAARSDWHYGLCSVDPVLALTQPPIPPEI